MRVLEPSLTSSLLTTKLYSPPASTNLVLRPRLIEQLNEGETCKLALISAPAGYGKSTLIGEWSRNTEKPVTWLSLDENDNNLKRFLTYFVAAIQKIDESVGLELLHTLEATDNPPLEPLFTTLINELSATNEQFYIVLDDYHVITLDTIHDSLDFFLLHQPQNAHLIVSGRVDPPFSLSRLRARGEMIEIRSNDLRFTESEVTAFLNDFAGLNLSPEEIVALLTRTEGWITGLQLAALSMRGRKDKQEFIAAFSGSHHYIIDYLIDEVLSIQPEEIQTFLLQTSILDRLNASLCDSVLGLSNSKEILHNLDETNLFLIPLDDERNWYRYHHLFADFLKQRLREKEANNIPELHRHASEWLKQNDFIIEAINHSLLGEDFVRAAQLVESIGPDMMMQSEFDQLASWLDAIPKEIVFSWPWLCIIQAWMCQRWARFDEGERYLLAAEQALENKSTPEPMGGKKVILGQVYALRALFALFRGQIPQSMEYATQALDYLPQDHFNRAVAADALGIATRANGDFDEAIKIFKEARQDSLKVGNRILAQAIILELGITQTLQGRLTQAADTFREAIDLKYQETRINIPYASSACIYLANILREWNDLDAAMAYLDKGIQIGQPAKMVDAVISGYASLARVHLSMRDMDDADKACKTAEKMGDEVPDLLSATINFMIDSKARLLLAKNQLAEASVFVRESGLDVNDEITFFDGFGHTILARILIYLGRDNSEENYLSEAQSLITKMLDIAKHVGCSKEEIELLVLQTLVFDAQGQHDKALETLNEALSLAEPERYVRTFIDEGEAIKQMLRQVESIGGAHDYVRNLLAAFDRDEKKEGATTSQPLIEPLSERELDVLKLLATELSGPEIAQELMVSLNTMRTHTKNIYAKLGVNSRRAAVNQAKELDLL